MTCNASETHRKTSVLSLRTWFGPGAVRGLLPMVFAMAFIPAASAQDAVGDPPPKPPLDTSAFVTLQFDNDFFGGSDSHYTNGMRAAYLSPEAAVPELMRKFGEIVPLFSSTYNMRFSITIGQNIYTPEDINLSDPPSDDRPYAGWLYTGFGLVSQDGVWLDKLELDLGIIGPYSYAKQTQTEWHRFFGFNKPQGWDRQLKTEPGVNLYYETSRRSLYEFPLTQYIPIENLGVDVTPHLGIALGNVQTHGAVGLTARFGDDLPADFGPPKIRPNLPGSDFFVLDDDIGWYFFGGVEGRGVLRNIFLDGNTFRGSRSVDKYPFVADFQGGLAITFQRARLSYTHLFRTPEFKGQNGFDTFGSVALSLRF